MLLSTCEDTTTWQVYSSVGANTALAEYLYLPKRGGGETALAVASMTCGELHILLRLLSLHLCDEYFFFGLHCVINTGTHPSKKKKHTHTHTHTAEAAELLSCCASTVYKDLVNTFVLKQDCLNVCIASSQAFLFFFLGYKGIVHPPSDDVGTERTWFEPEQRPSQFFCFVFVLVTGELSTLRPMMKVPEERPRKRVPVHGKPSPQGASKTIWRQDDQP